MKKCTYCGRENDDTLTTCQECLTTLPQEIFEPKLPRVPTPSQLRARNRALVQGIISTILSLIFLGGGWLYPVLSLHRELTGSYDPDLQIEPVIVLSLIASFVLAVLAVRSFWLAGALDAPTRLK
jgi:hypothetical protein